MAIIKLTIYVANPANVLGLFDEIQVHRSITGELGLYTEITAASAAAATLLSSNVGPFNLNGLTLLVKVNDGGEQTVTFVTADPINIDDVVDFVNANLTGATASEDTGALRFTGGAAGTGSILEITGGSALTELGFTAGDKDWGEDQRIPLVPAQTTYTYDDLGGDPTYWYMTRYYNSSTGDFSNFSDPVVGEVGSILPPTDLIKGVVQLAGLDGKPVVDRSVVFYNKYVPPLIVSDFLLADREVRIITDMLGYAETMLVKGAVVVVSVAGTGIVRQITVPATGSDFKVHDAIATADDLFQIRIPDVPAAVRRSL